MGIPLPMWVQQIRQRTAMRRAAFAGWTRIMTNNRDILETILECRDFNRHFLQETSLLLQGLRVSMLCTQSVFMQTLHGMTTLEHLVYLGEITKCQRVMNRITNQLEEMINDMNDAIARCPEISEVSHGNV